MVLALMRRFVSIKKPHQLKVQFADLLIDECYCHCHCRIGLVITSCLSPNLYSCSFHRSQCGTSDRRKSNKEFVQVVHLLMKRLIVGKSERRYCFYPGVAIMSNSAFCSPSGCFWCFEQKFQAWRGCWKRGARYVNNSM